MCLECVCGALGCHVCVVCACLGKLVSPRPSCAHTEPTFTVPVSPQKETGGAAFVGSRVWLWVLN